MSTTAQVIVRDVGPRSAWRSSERPRRAQDLHRPARHCYGTGRSTSHDLHSLASDIHLQAPIQLRVALMTHRSLQVVYIAALPSALDSSFFPHSLNLRY